MTSEPRQADRPWVRLGARLQAVALAAAIAGLRRLGPVRASELGGRVARGVGPLLPVSRVAERNLRQAIPELDAQARRRIIRGVWDNLGRTAAELPHLPGFARTAHGPGWEVVGEAHLAPFKAGAQGLFVSGHLGNWELMLPIAARLGIVLPGIYRAASNPRIDALIGRIRHEAMGGVPMFPKGARGARAALAHLRAGGSVALLFDQKMNNGIAVPFFGRPAMTAPALAQFALRFGAPILPVHIARIGPARFRMIVDPPITAIDTGDREADILATSAAMNATLERWIREAPASWLWLHRRWPKPAAG